MNRGPVLFLGVFVALAASWWGLVYVPQLQLGQATPGTNVVETTESYPAARPGLAQEGLQVYRSLGCATCHSQQVRQEGVRFEVLLTRAGTNTALVARAVRAARPDLPEGEVSHRISRTPAILLAEEPDHARVAALAKALGQGGARSEVRLIALGPDIARGWGRGRSVAADFLRDRPVLPGSQRIGPDLANVGLRLPSPEWHFRHLHDPQKTVAGSVMPPYRFLFEKSKAGAQGIVPSEGAQALVAYLLSLRADVPLLERPLASAEATASTPNPSRSSAVTNAPTPVPGP